MERTQTQDLPGVASRGEQLETGATRAEKAERLRQCRLAAGFSSARKAALKFNWPYPSYYCHEKGTRAYRLSEALVYAAAFGTSADYLLTGGNLNSKSLNSGQLSQIFRGIKQLPLLDVADIMSFRKMLAGAIPQSLTTKTTSLPADIPAGPRSFVLRIFDKAMSGGRPSLEVDSFAYFDPDAEIATGNVVAALIDGYPTIALRKYRQMPDEGGRSRFDLIPANEDFPGFSNATHGINLLGRLIGIWMPV